MSTRRQDCAWKVSADQSTEIRATTWNTDSQTGRITSSDRSGSLTITLPTAGGEACRFQRIGSLEYGRRPLRSSTDRTLTVPRTHNRFGDRSFAVAGPRLWNSLPISLRKISSYRQFRRYLKNHLFGIWEITAQCDAWFSALYKYSYLLTYLYARPVNAFSSNICIWVAPFIALCAWVKHRNVGASATITIIITAAVARK